MPTSILSCVGSITKWFAQSGENNSPHSTYFLSFLSLFFLLLLFFFFSFFLICAVSGCMCLIQEDLYGSKKVPQNPNSSYASLPTSFQGSLIENRRDQSNMNSCLVSLETSSSLCKMDTRSRSTVRLHQIKLEVRLSKFSMNPDPN